MQGKHVLDAQHKGLQFRCTLRGCCQGLVVEEEGFEPEPHLGCAEQLVQQLSLTLPEQGPGMGEWEGGVVALPEHCPGIHGEGH